MKTTTDARFLDSGDEAGTAPEDRKFRPDIQGLRAVAVGLVVLFHAGIPGLSGGYVGVDVFFVISGFVITGVLLRERTSSGRTSILAFYGRRARRIIPAATVVIVAVVLAAYFLLDRISGNQTAVDGQWASVFLANFHFAASGTNYLASQRPPAPLQNYWSLAVEEQFYLVYPTIFLLVASIATRRSLRARLTTMLVVVVVASYALSILQTSSNPSVAYFSPFTRAWELALGALVAVSTNALRRLPLSFAAGISWLGLGGIIASAFLFTPATPYPGSLVAIPVLGAALVISGGAPRPTWGAEAVLSLRPMQLVGLISYSLYLWHWPILTIAAERRGGTGLPAFETFLLLIVAIVLSVVTYRLVENPIRHLPLLAMRRWASVTMGVCLIGSGLAWSTVGVRHTQVAVPLADVPSGTRCPSPTANTIEALRAYYGVKSTPYRSPIRMVVVGDSTACTMLAGLTAIGTSYGVQVVNGAVVGCGIVSGRLDSLPYTKYCQGEVDHAEDVAIENGNPSIVLWGSTDEQFSIVVDTPTGSKVLTSGTLQWKAVMLRRIDTRVRQFIATGAKVVLLLEPPSWSPGHPTRPTPSDLAYERMNVLLRQVAARNRGRVGLVDLGLRVCPSGPPCPLVVNGIWVRGDGLHYSLGSSVWVARWLIPQILATAKNLS